MNTEKTPTQPQEVKTLRDEFALAALTGIMSHRDMYVRTRYEMKDLAVNCYKIADEMMKAREK